MNSFGTISRSETADEEKSKVTSHLYTSEDEKMKMDAKGGLIAIYESKKLSARIM